MRLSILPYKVCFQYNPYNKQQVFLCTILTVQCQYFINNTLLVMQSLNCVTASYLSGACKNSVILGCDNVSLSTFRRTEVGKQKKWTV